MAAPVVDSAVRIRSCNGYYKRHQLKEKKTTLQDAAEERMQTSLVSSYTLLYLYTYSLPLLLFFLLLLYCILGPTDKKTSATVGDKINFYTPSNRKKKTHTHTLTLLYIIVPMTCYEKQKNKIIAFVAK